LHRKVTPTSGAIELEVDIKLVVIVMLEQEGCWLRASKASSATLWLRAGVIPMGVTYGLNSDDWLDFYRDAKEAIPPNTLEATKHGVVITCFVDANHGGNFRDKMPNKNSDLHK